MADIYYVDVSKIGRDFVGKRDLSVMTNERAVLESVHNILTTRLGDRVMSPKFGCNLEKYLFEPINGITAIYLKKEIEHAIDIFEPRISSYIVDVSPKTDEYAYDVSVVFTIKVINTQQTLTFTLNQVR